MMDPASGRDMSGCDDDNTAYVIAPPLLGYHRHWDIYIVGFGMEARGQACL